MLLVASDASTLSKFYKVHSRLPGDIIQLSGVIPISQLMQWRLHLLVLIAESPATYSPGHLDIPGAGPSTHRPNLLLRLDLPQIQDLDPSSHNLRWIL